MKVISNMQLIAGSPESKTKSGSFSLKFDAGKVKDGSYIQIIYEIYASHREDGMGI